MRGSQAAGLEDCLEVLRSSGRELMCDPVSCHNGPLETNSQISMRSNTAFSKAVLGY